MPVGIVPVGTHDDGAADCELHLTQGDSISHTLALTDDNGDAVSLVGATAKAVVAAEWSGTALLTFDSTASPVTITINGVAGELLLTATHETTALLTVGTYVWSLWVEDTNGVKRTYCRGLARVHPRVAT